MLVVRRLDLYSKPVVPRPLLGRYWTPVGILHEPERPLEALVVNVPIGEIPPDASSLREIAEIPGERRVSAAAAIASLLTKHDSEYRATCLADGAALKVLGGVSKVPAPQAATFASSAGDAATVSFAVEAVEDEVRRHPRAAARATRLTRRALAGGRDRGVAGMDLGVRLCPLSEQKRVAMDEAAQRREAGALARARFAPAGGDRAGPPAGCTNEPEAAAVVRLLWG